MERLGIKRIDGEYPRVILYNNDKVSLEISFEGNLDLYFALKGADIDNKVIINETNLRVYAIFNELYESLINCSLPYYQYPLLLKQNINLNYLQKKFLN